MRFMMVVKATKETEAGVLPSKELLEAMLKYNEELAKAGVLIAAEGLRSSSHAVRISYPVPGEKPRVVDGPFTETKEIIAGFSIIEVKSKEEAVEWALRMPDPDGSGEGEIELLQISEPTDFIQDKEMLGKELEFREQNTRNNK